MLLRMLQTAGGSPHASRSWFPKLTPSPRACFPAAPPGPQRLGVCPDQDSGIPRRFYRGHQPRGGGPRGRYDAPWLLRSPGLLQGQVLGAGEHCPSCYAGSCAATCVAAAIPTATGLVSASLYAPPRRRPGIRWRATRWTSLGLPNIRPPTLVALAAMRGLIA